MIPNVEDLKSDPLIHRFGDMFNPPGLTNFLGSVQADLDLTGIRSLNFPPLGNSDHVTAGLFINDRYFPSLSCPVTFIWYPDRIERTAECERIRYFTKTVLCTDKKAVIIKLEMENRTAKKRNISIRFGFSSAVTNTVEGWAAFLPPSESDNDAQIDPDRPAVLFTAGHSRACFLQGVSPATRQLTENGAQYGISLAGGERQSLYYIGVISDTLQSAQQQFDVISKNIEKEINKSRDNWNDELKAIFTPGNDRYSGYLPTFESDDRALQRLYHTAILSVVYFKRDNPASIIGRVYETLMPRYWQTVTFIWDYFLSAQVHALLDPEVMKKYLSQWLLMDLHKHFGIEYLTGQPVGPWYAVNDYAICSMIHEYLRWNSNMSWLNEKPHDVTGKKHSQRRVIDYLIRHAESWKFFQSDSGLADYGDINNLLECVSTYVHEVASLNAANVFNCRSAAEILAETGQKEKGTQLQDDAAELLNRVQKLYVDGKGYWRARHPGNKQVDVRHCYDLITIFNTIPADLSQKQKKAMTQFLKNELQTDCWIRALSPADANAMFSVRPDHQWNGAYPAWPAQAVAGLYRIGRAEMAFEWLKGLACSANQGPFGQAHFVGSAVPTECGGARKAPPDFPYMCDWAVSGGGSWINIFIEGIFGVKATLNKGVTAEPQLAGLAADAELKNLNHQGKRYHVSKKGIRPA